MGKIVKIYISFSLLIINNSNMINFDFNFISHVLILIGKVLVTQFGKKKKHAIANCSNVKFKLFTNCTKLIRSLVHPYTFGTFSLYSQCNILVQWCKFYISHKLCVHVCVNYIFNGLVEKMVDDLGLNFFSKHHYCGKY